MSDTATEEQVVEDIPEGTDPAPAAEVDAVDAFLSEFEDEEQESQTEQPEESTDEVAKLRQEVKALREDTSAKVVNEHVQKLKDSIRFADEDFANLPDALISDFLDGVARREPAVTKAFEKSISDPKTFQGLVDVLKTRLGEQIAAVATRNIADDIKAATSSARGISTSQPAPEPVDTKNMTQAEFDAHVKTLPRS